MRIGVAIDAACDLPQDFLERNGIAVMPITVKVDGQKFKDDRDPVDLADRVGQPQRVDGARRAEQRGGGRQYLAD